jgi:quercetin dioxygenase-like cupin family protein/CDGSH-type Zn-finger protein
MSAPIVAARKPCLVALRAGRPYHWCACGRSARQPFCDGSHAGSGIEPLRFVADADGDALLCACKRTKRAPFCDGSHNALSDTYEEASAEDIAASASIAVTPREREGEGVLMSRLDGGCYVCTVDSEAFLRRGVMRLAEAIGAGAGARFLSQYVIELDNGASDIFRFAASDTVLFTMSGGLRLTISGRRFDLSAEDGAFILAGEAIQLENRGRSPVRLLMTVCPQPEGPEWLETMQADFDPALPERVFGVDPSKREPMADRFYQVLIGEETGSNEVTQFVGEIPRSRAAAHHHLYEEAIMILSGEGYMWTENARAAISPGDIIFLPRKQIHSLECASPGGMRVMGAFYPSGSPAVNY